MDAGADLEERDKGGLTPLHWAAGSNENPAVITALVDAGADLEERSKAALRLCIGQLGRTRIQPSSPRSWTPARTSRSGTRAAYASALGS